MPTNPFLNLERLASSISSREQIQHATSQARQERLQDRKRRERMHSHAMSVFAMTDIMLNKLHRGGRFG